MELSASFELTFNGHRIAVIRTQPNTPPDAMADMFDDAAVSIQIGMDAMMEPGEITAPDTDLIIWRYFDYEPEEAEALSNSLGENDAPPPEAGLSARLELWMERERMIEIRFHPRTPPDSLAAVFADLAELLRNDFKNIPITPALLQHAHETETGNGSATPPATFSGKAINNLIEAALSKMIIAMDYGDDEVAQKHFDKAEKLYEWQINNYTPEAIENGPAPSAKT